MKKIILVIGLLVFVQLGWSELTQDTTHQLKLIKLTEDAITDDSYKPIAGKEKLLAVKVVDKSGKGVFGAEVRFEIVSGDGELVENSTTSIPTNSLVQQSLMSGDTLVIFRGKTEGTCTVRASLLKELAIYKEFVFNIVAAPKNISINKMWKDWVNMPRKIKASREETEIKSNSPWSPSKRTIRTTRKGDRSKTEEMLPKKITKFRSGEQKEYTHIPRDWDMVEYNKAENSAIFRFRSDRSSYIPCKYYTFDLSKGILLQEEHFITNGIIATRIITKYNDYQKQEKYPGVWLWTEKEEIFMKNLSEVQYETKTKVNNREIDIPIADKEIQE